MPIPKPNKFEREDEFIKRCMSDEKMKSEYDQEQRYAVCSDAFIKLESLKISFDYDGTLSTAKGTKLAQELISKGNTIYIISARSSRQGMLSKAKQLGISFSRVYATGSNKAKVEKVKELNIDKHYDNNIDVVNELGNVGKLFSKLI
jgi:soluble P-type ATPase